MEKEHETCKYAEQSSSVAPCNNCFDYSQWTPKEHKTTDSLLTSINDKLEKILNILERR